MKMRKAHDGFSLVELLVATAIGVAILTVLGTVFSQTSSGRSDLERVSRLVENSRFAADLIGEDLRHAGFYGTFMTPTTVTYVDADPCVWNAGDVTTLGWRPNDAPPNRNYPGPLQGWDDPAGGILTCLERRVPGTDVIAIRRVSSIPLNLPAQAAQVVNTGVYVQDSRCSADPGTVSNAVLLRVSNTVADLNVHRAGPAPCNTAAPLSPVRRYFVRVYYVAACNDCTGGGDGIPTLKRVENAGAPVSLAEGVQELQFEYGFDTNGDGVPDQFLTTTGAGATASWANVVSVRMYALMRSSEAGLTADTTPTLFDLGPDHESVACPPRFRCRLMTSTFRLNNVAGRRES